MRCYICNSVLEEIQFNEDHKDIDPCPTCLGVIEDTVGRFGDRPAAAEDELGEDFILESLYSLEDYEIEEA